MTSIDIYEALADAIEHLDTLYEKNQGNHALLQCMSRTYESLCWLEMFMDHEFLGAPEKPSRHLKAVRKKDVNS